MHKIPIKRQEKSAMHDTHAIGNLEEQSIAATVTSQISW